MSRDFGVTIVEDALDEVSRVYSDPLVQLDITLSGTILLEYRHQVFKSVDELRKILASVFEKYGGDKCISLTLSFETGSEARLLVCEKMLLAALYKEAGTTLVGKPAYRKLLETLGRVKGYMDIIVVEKGRLPSNLQEVIERVKPRPPAPRGMPPDAWVGFTLYGFRVTRVVGKGGLSYVLEAEGPLGRVALKILREKSSVGTPLAIGNRSALESFVRMGSCMLRLSLVDSTSLVSALEDRGVNDPERIAKYVKRFSANVVRVYGVYAPKESYERLEDYLSAPPTIVMEFLEGKTLADIEHTLTPAEVVRVIREVAGALAIAHLLGFGHFDVKPQNIMVLRRGAALQVKLLDFTALPTIPRPAVLEEVTPEYADPHALLHGLRATPSYDVYSLGIVAFRLVYRRPPYARIALNYVTLKLVTPRLAEALNSRLPPQARNYVRVFERLFAASKNIDEFLATAEEFIRRVEPVTEHPAYPRSFIQVLSKMLSLDPRQRYRDAFELLMDLAPELQG